MRQEHRSLQRLLVYRAGIRLGIIVTVGATAVPQTVSSVDAYRAAGAARYLSGRMQRARMEAVATLRGGRAPVQRDRRGAQFATYLDGNRTASSHTISSAASTQRSAGQSV